MISLWPQGHLFNTYTVDFLFIQQRPFQLRHLFSHWSSFFQTWEVGLVHQFTTVIIVLLGKECHCDCTPSVQPLTLQPSGGLVPGWPATGHCRRGNREQTEERINVHCRNSSLWFGFRALLWLPDQISAVLSSVAVSRVCRLPCRPPPWCWGPVQTGSGRWLSGSLTDLQPAVYVLYSSHHITRAQTMHRL